MIPPSTAHPPSFTSHSKTHHTIQFPPVTIPLLTINNKQGTTQSKAAWYLDLLMYSPSPLTPPSEIKIVPFDDDAGEDIGIDKDLIIPIMKTMTTAMVAMTLTALTPMMAMKTTEAIMAILMVTTVVLVLR